MRIHTWTRICGRCTCRQRKRSRWWSCCARFREPFVRASPDFSDAPSGADSWLRVARVASAALQQPLDRRNHRTQDDVSQDAVVDPMAGEAEDQAKLVDGHAS